MHFDIPYRKPSPATVFTSVFPDARDDGSTADNLPIGMTGVHGHCGDLQVVDGSEL